MRMTLPARESRLNIATSMTIGQELRTVGQGLESLDVEDFDLRCEGDGYFALGIRNDQAQNSKVPRFDKVVAGKIIQSLWQNLIGENSSDRKLSDPGADVLRILFTPEGLLRLEAAGITKRNPHAQGIPDSRKLGQILRIVGEGIDAKSGRLIRIRRRRQRISFEYATHAEAHTIEEWKLSELAELWLDASKQRHEIANIAEGSPSVLGM
jgi:hypothetical protein